MYENPWVMLSLVHIGPQCLISVAPEGGDKMAIGKEEANWTKLIPQINPWK